MAVDFGANLTEANPLPSTTSPKQGVAKSAPEPRYLLNAFDQVGNALKTQKANKNEAILNQFRLDQIKVGDALAQNKIKTSAGAQTRLRHNLMLALEANPMLGKEIVDIHKNITGLTGGAKITVNGTQEEQDHRANRSRLIQAGLLNPDAQEEEYKSVAEAERVSVAATKKYQETMNTLNLQEKKLGVASAERKAITEQKKEAAEAFVAQGAEAEFYKLRTDFDKIVASNATEAEKIAQIEDQYLDWNAQVMSVLGDVSSERRVAFQSTFDSLRDNYVEKASGAQGDAELDRKIKRKLGGLKALALEDPTIARLAMTSDLVSPDMFSKILAESDASVVKAYTRFVAGLHVSGEVEFSSVFTDNNISAKGMNLHLSNLSRDLVDPEKKEEATRQVGVILNSIEDDVGRIVRDPKKAIPLMDWLASPSFLKAISTNPDAFTNLDGVKSALDQHYYDEVNSMLAAQFTQNEIWLSPTQAARRGESGLAALIPFNHATAGTTEGVAVRSTRSGMEFYATGDQKNGVAQSKFEQKARQLNKDLKPIINKHIQAQAHLAGHSNYSEVWEQNAERVLELSGGGGSDNVEGSEGKDRLGGGDAGDDLLMDDYVFTQVNTKSLPTEVAKDEPFVGAVEELASKYETDPSVLMAIMDFETGGSFDPAQKNAAGSSGTGLIQFMSETAKGMGTSVEALAGMDRLEQIKWVEKYFDQYASKLKGGTVEDFYMAVLYPKAIGKSNDYVIFRDGTSNYKMNKGLDRSGDGTVTKAEASRKVKSFVAKYKKRKQ